MKKFVTVFALSLLLLKVGAQSAAKSIYAELGGPSIAAFNFDMRFNGREDGLGGRIGIGGFKIDGEGAVFVPLGLNYLLGKDQRNYFEVGAGLTIVDADNSSSGDLSSTFGHLSIGYRLQPKNGGFLFRAAITPVFGNGFFIPYYGGISIGYKF